MKKITGSTNYKKVMAGVVVMLLSGYAMAVNVSWSAGDGNWNVDGNWAQGHVPTSSDIAYINNGGTSTVTSAVVTPTEVRVGYNAAGTLEVASGGALSSSNRSYIGYTTGGDGTLSVNGGTFTAGSELRTYTDATIAVKNGGTLNSTSHLLLSYAGGTSSLTVDGSGSTVNSGSDAYIGRGGASTLSIANGGVMTVYDDMWLGDLAAGSGSALVTGVGSALKLGDIIYVGDAGAGTLTIEDGGLVQAGRMTVDFDETGDDGVVQIGEGGMLALEDGGTAATDLTAFLAFFSGGTDNVDFDNGSGWKNIEDGVLGTDYTLDQYTDGATSYSRLTVIPEPGVIGLFAIVGSLILMIRRHFLM